MTLHRWPPGPPTEGGWGPVAAFGGAPKLPEPPPPQPMPDLQDPALLALKRRAAVEAQTRSGRLSTMLSDAGNTDSGTYSGSTLGLR